MTLFLSHAIKFSLKLRFIYRLWTHMIWFQVRGIQFPTLEWMFLMYASPEYLLLRQSQEVINSRERKRSYKTRSLNVCGKLFKYPCILWTFSYIFLLLLLFTSLEQSSSRVNETFESVFTTHSSFCLWNQNHV